MTVQKKRARIDAGRACISLSLLLCFLKGNNVSTKPFTLASLQSQVLNGFLLFTDAVETGEEIAGIVFLSNTTREGIDIALLNTGFNFIPEKGNVQTETFWMHRESNEHLRYHPIREKSFSVFNVALDKGFKTRVDFFCNQISTAAFDVTRELLNLGYKVMTYNPEHANVWHLIFTDDNGNTVIQEVA